MGKIADGAILKIKRPDGAIEEVVNTRHAVRGVIPSNLYSKMVAETRKAGRGDILSQRPNMIDEPEMSLDVQRMVIAGRLQDCAGAFPGSKTWQQGVELEKQLAAFDAAHPEIAAALVAERKERTAVGVARAMRGAD